MLRPQVVNAPVVKEPRAPSRGEHNIILTSTKFGDLNLEMGDNASFFKDENPDAAPDAKYKGFVLSRNPRGLIAINSRDGIHWESMSEQPVLTEGAFDSQNVGFWDSEINAYRAYWRYFEKFVDKKNKMAFVESGQSDRLHQMILFTGKIKKIWYMRVRLMRSYIPTRYFLTTELLRFL